MKTNLKIYTFFLLCACLLSNAQEKQTRPYFIDVNETNLVVNDIIQDEIGYLWLATNKGLYQYDGISFSKKTVTKTQTLFAKKDSLFIGTENKLLVFTNGKLQSIESNSIQKIIEIDNRICLATNQGLFIYKDNIIKPLPIEKTINFSIIYDMLKVDNQIYIASNKGLWSFVNLEKPKSIQKIATGNFNKLIENRKHILATSPNGFVEIIMNNKVINTIISEVSISDIFKINEEIWVTTNGFGIDIYSANDYAFRRKINKYNSPISDNLGAIYVDKYQTIWLGAKNNKLFKISDKNFNIEETPSLKLEAINVNFNKINSTKNKKLQLKADQSNISFSYKTVSLANANKIEYRHKINGNYSSWSKSNTVAFANLNAGNYHFYAQSKIGNQLSKEVYIPFIIDNPFYKKGWFYIVTITSFFIVIFLILEFRFQKNKKENQKKIEDLKLQHHLISLEHKALQLQMNPHFIFNVLNGIKAFGNSGKITKMNETISEFSVLLRSILSNSRTEEISLKEEVKVLKNYLALAQKINSKTFNYSIKIALNNIDAEEILIPPMLVQPFIENSITHGFQPYKKDNKIEILFEVKHRFLQCTVLDNGIGVHQSKLQKSNKTHQSVALQITKERIVNLCLKNCFSIEEIKENSNIYGTKVWFKIPLKIDY